jgi:hypothetical protein
MSKPRIGIVMSTTRSARFADKAAAWISGLADARAYMDCEVVDLRNYPMPFFDEPMYIGGTDFMGMLLDGKTFADSPHLEPAAHEINRRAIAVPIRPVPAIPIFISHSTRKRGRGQLSPIDAVTAGTERQNHQKAAGDRHVLPEVDEVGHALGRCVSPVRMEKQAGGNRVDRNSERRPTSPPAHQHEQS